MFTVLDVHKGHHFLKWLSSAKFPDQNLSEIAGGADHLRWIQDLLVRVAEAANKPAAPAEQGFSARAVAYREPGDHPPVAPDSQAHEG